MKKLMIVLALAAFTTTYAQETKNKNKKTTTTVVKTAVEDSDGVEVSTKEVTKTRSQKLALNDFDGTHNFNTVMRPVNTSTDVDYYNDGVMYRFVPQDQGYYIVNTKTNNKKFARVFPTSQKGYYIYSENGNNAFGYFNEDGDFVIESYDPDGDGVMNYVYKLNIDEDTKKKMMKDKMK